MKIMTKVFLKFLLSAIARHFITWDWESQDADEVPKYKGLIEIVSLKRFPKHLFIAWEIANHTIRLSSPRNQR